MLQKKVAHNKLNLIGNSILIYVSNLVRHISGHIQNNMKWSIYKMASDAPCFFWHSSFRLSFSLIIGRLTTWAKFVIISAYCTRRSLLFFMTICYFGFSVKKQHCNIMPALHCLLFWIKWETSFNFKMALIHNQATSPIKTKKQKAKPTMLWRLIWRKVRMPASWDSFPSALLVSSLILDYFWKNNSLKGIP